ncbi:hypothetical protein Lal_00042523 [Lupinus albus]|nr:hypothetical protein Lal_00042523 [Lupinus albus]
MGSQERKRVRIESFTSSQALGQESMLLDLGNVLFPHLSSILNLKILKIWGVTRTKMRISLEEIEASFNPINLDNIFQEDDPLSEWIEERKNSALDGAQIAE